MFQSKDNPHYYYNTAFDTTTDVVISTAGCWCWISHFRYRISKRKCRIWDTADRAEFKHYATFCLTFLRYFIVFSQMWLRYVWLMAWQIRLSVVCDMRAH